MITRTRGWIGMVLLAAVPALAQTPADSFDSNGVRISYAEKGKGEPVVLLHGLTGSYQRHWEAPGVMQALETAGYRAIGMDCRGHGQSGKPHAPEQYGLEMVRDVVRLLDHLKIERAHVVGYSMGGSIANQLLIGYPARLLTVTLLGAGWEGDDPKALTAPLQLLADGFARKDASWLIRGVTSGDQKGPSDEDVAALNASLFARNDPEALAAATRGLVPLYDVPSKSLRAATVPVLAIVGELDKDAVASVVRMAGVVKGLQVVTIPGATHASSVKPAAAPLVAFLDKHRQR
jgi:pimeloyl-ACP methyl ester carboxylesterase